MATPTYNLKDLSHEIAKEFGLTQQSGARIARFAFDRIKQELSNGKQVRVHKFGTLMAKKRAAGVARNPASGERVVIPARKVVRLTVSPALRSQINSID